MRRRLFWTITGVAVVTGLLVLAASAVASQRAAVDATFRELNQSAQEAVSIIDDTIDRAGQRPGAALELFRLLEGDQVGPTLARIRRTAGSSEIAFAAIDAEGDIRASAPLFDRFLLDVEKLESGGTQFERTTSGELVVVAPTAVELGGRDVTLVVALAREAPIVRLADQMRGMLLIAAAIVLVAALAARLFSNRLAERLEPLATASRRVAGGEHGVRVPDLGDPELDEVATAFNEMAGELERSETREREFILGVGHDLRTPLTTIGGYAEALETGDIEAGDLARVGAVLGTQTRQLSRLVEDLSMLARLEQPEFSLRSEQVDVGAHVTEVLEGFQRNADQARVMLVVDAPTGTEVSTDPDRLGQIAQNLVENALRYTPETGTVTVSVKSVGDGAILEVNDTGTGITPEDLPHIFDRHFVGRHRQVRNQGSGLGLSIVSGLVSRMGGTVEATSNVGKGTTIRVSLPQSQPSD